MSSLSGFKASLLGGGARANQFKVMLNFPAAVNNTQIAMLAVPFLVKSASLPAINVGVAPVYYHGRLVPLAGERSFDPWSVSIYNDNNFVIRNALERWSNLMNNFADNTGITSPLAYKADARVQQLDRNGAVMKTYKFVGIFPQAISEIGLDFGQNDQVEEFSVTFAYEHYEAEDGASTGLSIPL